VGILPKGDEDWIRVENKFGEAQCLINIRSRKDLSYVSPIEFLSGKCVSCYGDLGIGFLVVRNKN